MQGVCKQARIQFQTLSHTTYKLEQGEACKQVLEVVYRQAHTLVPAYIQAQAYKQVRECIRVQGCKQVPELACKQVLEVVCKQVLEVALLLLWVVVLQMVSNVLRFCHSCCSESLQSHPHSFRNYWRHTHQLHQD